MMRAVSKVIEKSGASAAGRGNDEQDWHSLSVDEVLARLQTTRDGLSDSDVQRRLEEYGPNVITHRGGLSAFARFMLQFHAALVYILLVAVVVTLILGKYVDSAVIFAVVIVNAIVGFLQESKALKAIEALSRTLSPEATVLRAGKRVRIPAANVVPGDVILIKSGDSIAADARVVESHDLHADESMLTGESLPVHKKTDTLDPDSVLADRVNMVYASTLVTRGSGAAVVTATGDRTEVGRISELISEAEQIATPLTKKIAQFSRFLVAVILVVASLMFVVGVLRGMTFTDTFMASVALAVGAIPEGLPAVVTIMLAIGVKRMAARRAIIRKLPAVEALGSTTVICSDKTGTLTENKMTVQSVWAGGEEFTVTGIGFSPKGEIRKGDQAADLKSNQALRECLIAGLLCNDSELAQSGQEWKIQGDPTEAALLVVGAKSGLNREDLLREMPRIDEIPFESDRQYMATLHRTNDGALAMVKGSVERVLTISKAMMNADGQAGPLDTSAIQEIATSLGSRGLRVLAFATARFPSETTALSHDRIEGAMVFTGLQAMLDPPRAEAIRAVAECQRAGIIVKMITGDHAVTAASIAAQLGLIAPSDEQSRNGSHTQELVITGKDMTGIADDELPKLAERINIFARMTPEQKLRLVRGLQQRGHVVAMTGDGVNDGPALRQADIGVAMGVDGTEVAKAAADMVLADDNFASIEAAVEEGRTVFDNLTKFIVWTLPTNGGEALVILSAVVVGGSLPMLPVQALYINMTTALLLGLPLAFEARESDVMARPPRDPNQPLMTFDLIMRTGLVSILIAGSAFALFEWSQWMGMSIEQSRTIVVSVVVVCELAYLFNCRSLVRSAYAVGLFSNPWVWVGSATMIAVHALFVYTPFLARLFQLEPIKPPAWLAVAGAGVLVSFVVGVEKLIRRRMSAR